jgi:hypothetical protein
MLQGDLTYGSSSIIWRETEVDYRAVARRLVLAASPGGLLWAATDTGIIMKLEQN